MKSLKRMFAAAVAAATMGLGASGAFAGERVTVDYVANHYPWDGKVDCVCTMSGLDASFAYQCAYTLTVKKDGALVRRTVTNGFAVVDGTCTNTFDCAALFGAGLYLTGGLAVELVKGDAKPEDATGTPIGIVGDVLVVDVSGGSAAQTYPTSELTRVDLGVFNCAAYKTDKIVLRKIPAGTYYCQPGAGISTVVSQQLTTKGFYIGVFPVTQRQYERVMGSNPSKFQTDATGNPAAERPVEKASWNMIRGGVAAGTAITATSADSFLQRLVAKTGLTGFDLPTEAQWEMASRAGATAAYGAYWNGSSAVEMTASNLGDAAWYVDNASSTTHAVGGKKPNMWGLYDTQGNVWEFCRDINISSYNTSYVDVPCTETSFGLGAWRVIRGGCWDFSAGNCRPSARHDGNEGSCFCNYGFRLQRTLP